MGTIGDVPAAVPTRIQVVDRYTMTTRHDEPLTKAAISFGVPRLVLPKG